MRIAPFAVVLDRWNALEPDVLWLSDARSDRLREDGLHGAPDLVVEVLSPSTRRRDLGVKLDLYARHGVREYWLVDPLARNVHVHRWEAGQVAASQELGPGETLHSPLLLGFALPADEVFAGP